MSTQQFSHRWGFFWFSSLKLPPLLFQRYTLWCPPPYGLLSLLGSLKMPGAWLPSATFSWPRGKLRKCRLPPRLPSLLVLCSSFLQTASHPQSSLRRGSHWYLSSCIPPKFWRHLSTCQVFSSPLSRISSQDSAAGHIPSWRERYPVLLGEDNFNL